jgi:hypothetical protein
MEEAVFQTMQFTCAEQTIGELQKERNPTSRGRRRFAVLKQNDWRARRCPTRRSYAPLTTRLRNSEDSLHCRFIPSPLGHQPVTNCAVFPICGMTLQAPMRSCAI